MKLIHRATGNEVEVGDTVRDSRDNPMIVSGWQKPTSAASSGRINVVNHVDELPHRMTLGQSFYPNVYDCEWIEREDRAELDKYPVGSPQNPRIIRTRDMMAAQASERAERGEPYNERDGG